MRDRIHYLDLPAEELARRLEAIRQVFEDPFAERGLTPRQREVASLVVRGYTKRQIARSLSISEATVRNHTAMVARKLGLESSRELTQMLLSGIERLLD